MRRRWTVLVIKLMSIALVLMWLIRKRAGTSALVLLMVMALQLMGCVTDAPIGERDRASAQAPGAGSATPAGDDPDESEVSDELGTGGAPDDTSCPDPRTCGDPNSNPGGGAQ
jgi:hypothetical protein